MDNIMDVEVLKNALEKGVTSDQLIAQLQEQITNANRELEQEKKKVERRINETKVAMCRHNLAIYAYDYFSALGWFPDVTDYERDKIISVMREAFKELEYDPLLSNLAHGISVTTTSKNNNKSRKKRTGATLSTSDIDNIIDAFKELL